MLAARTAGSRRQLDHVPERLAASDASSGLARWLAGRCWACERPRARSAQPHQWHVLGAVVLLGFLGAQRCRQLDLDDAPLGRLGLTDYDHLGRCESRCGIMRVCCCEGGAGVQSERRVQQQRQLGPRGGGVAVAALPLGLGGASRNWVHLRAQQRRSGGGGGKSVAGARIRAVQDLCCACTLGAVDQRASGARTHQSARRRAPIGTACGHQR